MDDPMKRVEPADPSPPPPSKAPPRPGRRIALLAASLGLVVTVVAAMLLQGKDHPRAKPQGRTTGNAVIALAFARGQSTSYDLHMGMRGSVSAGSLHQRLNMDLSETITWDVVSVGPSGVATVRLSGSDISGSVNGVGIPTPSKDLSFTMRISQDGRILSVNGLALGGSLDSGGLGFPGLGQLTPILPEQPVSPGDTWRKTFSQRFPFGSGRLRYTSRSTFERFDDWNGTRAAVIRTRYRVPFDITLDFGRMLEALGSGASTPGARALQDASIAYGGSGAFTMRSWIDLGAKQMLKCTSSGHFDMTMRFSGLPPQAQDVPGTISFTGRFTQELARR